MTYTINQHGGVIRDSDGMFIPEDPANSDYAAYLAWVAAGNTASSTVAITPQSIAQELSGKIDDLVASIYAGFNRFQQEYLLREQAAQAFKDGGYVGDPGVWVTSFSQSAGVGYQQATDTILAQAVKLNGALCDLGALRMRKYEILNASDAITAQTLYTEITGNINAIAAAIE